MKFLPIAATLLLASQAATAQPPPGEPLMVDVHASPYRASINVTVNISRQRFDMRNATIVNMLDFVLGREDDDGREDSAIVGGPTWIDLDRFDVAAMIPSLKPATLSQGPLDTHTSRSPYDQARPVMQRVLSERFHLKYHTQDQPLPGYIATLGKESPRLTEAKDPAAANICQTSTDKSTPGQTLITCTSATIAQLLASFDGVFPHPLLDRTGLTKPYDLTLSLSTEQLRTRAGHIRALTDALSKQLGVVIARGDVPQPATFVDAVERPTQNPPEIAKLIPALPDLEFEVASIRPAAADEPQSQMHPAGSQITFTNFALQELLRQAWQLRTGAMLGNAPPWLSQQRYTIRVKLPPEIDARAVSQDRDQLDNMLQRLLVDRFGIKYHWGEQVQDGWVLLPGNPKMKKADPRSRSFCKYGPPEGERDIRTAGSPFDAEFHCQNVTMAQFADLAQPMANSEIKNRVPDKTGLTGSYDFTVYYTTSRKLNTDLAAAQAAARQTPDATSEPAVGYGVADAFRKQLGLRLEKQSGSYPALILDHIERTPTGN